MNAITAHILIWYYFKRCRYTELDLKSGRIPPSVVEAEEFLFDNKLLETNIAFVGTDVE